MDEQKTPDPVATPAEEVPAPVVDIKAEAAQSDNPVEVLAGVPEGTELESHGVAHKEIVVADYKLDEEGNQVLDENGQPIVDGWHKEVV